MKNRLPERWEEYKNSNKEKPAVIKKRILEYENKIIEALNELKM